MLTILEMMKPSDIDIQAQKESININKGEERMGQIW